MNAKASATKVCPGCSARYPPDALFCPNDGSPLSANYSGDRESDAGPISGGEGIDTYLGREISGHIEIRKLAGVGAMGRVYRAFQRGIDRDVAVKVLHRELSANQQLVARFHREAKVASRLQHPNVVQVHLAGQLPDGAMYIVMEYLDGLSLQSALAGSAGPFPLERALHVALQICDAAGEAHSQGVVHRDIKPENVMLIRRGDDPDFVKVLDFGIARLNWGEQSMATAAGLIFGTARYISPEGAQGEAVGPEGDVYATATLLYQMLAGRTPFEGEQAVALLIQQIHDTPPPLRSIPAAQDVPEALAAVIMRNLSKSPADRAPDARTFGRSLVEAAKSVGLTPEDLVPRSSLFVPHARLSDPSPSHPPVKDLRESRPPENAALATTVSASSPPPVAQKTQMWNPPSPSVSPTPPVPPAPVAPPAHAGFPPPSNALPKIAPPSSVSPPPVTSASPAPRVEAASPAPGGDNARESNVDRTLDDSNPVRAPVVSPTRIRTEPALLPPIGLLLPPTPSPAVVQAEPPVAPPRAVLGSHPSLLATLDDPEEQQSPLGAGGPMPARRIAGIVIICLLLGVLGASVVMYQLGIVGGSSQVGSLDEMLTHADEALKHSRWDAPAGDNVRDITNDGLTKWPKEPRLLDLRARATDELVKEAVGRKFAGDLPAALHLARLANELDPSDTTAQHLVDEYEQAAKKTATDPSSTPIVPTLAVPSPMHGGSPHPTPSGLAGANAPKAAVEASLPHPRVGQPITFTAKVAGPTGPARSIEEPRFVINGPGLGTDTKLGALAGNGGTFVATFAGFEPGKYEIAFDAKVDGAMVRALKTVVIEGDAPLPPVPSTPPAPSAAPSGKWL